MFEISWLVYYSVGSNLHILGPFTTEREAKTSAEHLQQEDNNIDHVWFGPVQMRHA